MQKPFRVEITAEGLCLMVGELMVSGFTYCLS
jgi:hypothetical protein